MPLLKLKDIILFMLNALQILKEPGSVKKKKGMLCKHIMASIGKLEEMLREEARKDLDYKIDNPHRFL